MSQGDSQLAIVHDPGGKGQTVSRLPVGSKLDEVANTRGTNGTLYVADTTLNSIYTVQTSFPLGTFFVEAPQGAPTQSFIGTLNSATGVLTPLLTQRDGIVNPTALVFVTSGAEDDD